VIKFTDYYGGDVWVSPDRVLVVRDGGCGSRGVSATIVLDNDKTISVSGYAADVAKKIDEARK
jgi:hypothetical protein